jgi:hypothetical protein
MNCIRPTLLILTILPIVLMAQPTVRLNVQNAPPGIGTRIAVTVEIKGIRDLDTYTASIGYDHQALRLVDAALDAPLMNINNVLRSRDRTLLPVIKKEQGVVSIAATLTGENPSDAIENGVIGIALFEVISDPPGKIALEKVQLLDSKGKRIECIVADH